MRTVPLGEACEIVSGATPKSGVAGYWGGDVAWVTPADLSVLDSPYISATPRTLTADGLANCSARVLPPGSVLLSSRAPIGHVAINTIPMATNQGFKSLVPRPDLLDAKYLFHWLRHNKKFLQSLGNGATFKELSKTTVERIQLPAPALDEQRRIAAMLDQAERSLVLCRAGLDELAKLPQALLAELLAGRDVEADEHVELAAAVAPGTIVTYGIVQAGPEFDGGVPYIRTGDLVDGRIASASLRRTDPKIAAKFSRSQVREDDIVMSIRATVGTTAMVPAELAGANLTQGTARISPGPRFLAKFMLELLRSPRVQNWIERQVKGATFREITLSRLREMQLWCPDIALQQSFVDAVAARDKHRAKAERRLGDVQLLAASLSHRAFSGML